MTALGELVRETNKYMSSSGRGAAAADDGTQAANLHLLRAASEYVNGMFRVFGLVDAAPTIGFSAGGAGAADGAATPETLLAPYLDALAGFRETVREAAREGNLQRVLTACDALRNDALRPLGVVLEDEGAATGSGKWKLRDPAELRKEDEEKRVAAAEKVAKKAEAAAEAKRKAAEKEEKARVAPAAMFLSRVAEFSAFDPQGVPTHDAAGAVLLPAVVKRLQKERTQQDKLHQWWVEKYGSSRGGGAPLEGDGSAEAGGEAAKQ